MSILLLIVLSALATYAWRVLGVAIGARLGSDTALFHWLSCVAYALLAGLMARIVVFPAGILAESTLLSRALAMAAGFVVFFILGRHWLAATIVSSLLFGVLVAYGL